MNDTEKNGNPEEIEKKTPEEKEPVPADGREQGGYFTQDELDRMIKKRLDQQQRKFERQLAELKAAAGDPDEVETLKAKAAEQDELLQLAKKENEELKAAQAERDLKDLKLYNAQRYGLPLDLLDNITGSTPDEIEKSAQNLAAYAKSMKRPEPLFSGEPHPWQPERSTEEGWASMLSDLKEQGLGENHF